MDILWSSKELGSFRLDLRKKKIHGKSGQDWNGLPRDMVESPALDVFRSHLDVVPEDMV